MLFSPDHSKPAQEVLFSRTQKVQSHPTIIPNNSQVERGILLDEKLSFKQHIDDAILKINRGISVIKKLRHSLPRISLLQFTKLF